MIDNEMLLISMITAMKKGLQEGKLDISDMELLQAHLDNEVAQQIAVRSQELGESYTNNLNNYILGKEQEFDRRIRDKDRELDNLSKKLEETEKKINDVGMPKWAILTRTGLIVLGAVASVLATFLMFLQSFSAMYTALWDLQWWHWITWILIVVGTFLIGFIIVLIYAAFILMYFSIMDRFNPATED